MYVFLWIITVYAWTNAHAQTQGHFNERSIKIHRYDGPNTRWTKNRREENSSKASPVKRKICPDGKFLACCEAIEGGDLSRNCGQVPDVNDKEALRKDCFRRGRADFGCCDDLDEYEWGKNCDLLLIPSNPWWVDQLEYRLSHPRDKPGAACLPDSRKKSTDDPSTKNGDKCMSDSSGQFVDEAANNFGSLDSTSDTQAARP